MHKSHLLKALLASSNLAVILASSSIPAATAPTLSGQCGLLLTKSTDGFETLINNDDKIGQAIAGIVDFSTSQIYASMTLTDFYGTTNAVNTEDGPGYESFSLRADSIPGAYILSITMISDNQPGSLDLQLIPTNNGKTLLVKSIPTPAIHSGAWTGICQAI